MQNYKKTTNFAHDLRYLYVPVVQWIEYWIPVPTIGVRLPTGILEIKSTLPRGKADLHYDAAAFMQQCLFRIGIPGLNQLH